LAEHEIRSGVAGARLAAAGVERRVVLEHSAAAVIGTDAADILARAAVVARDCGEAPVLAEDKISRGIAGGAGDAGRAAAGRERIVVFEDAAVVGVSNEDVAGWINRDPGWKVEPVDAAAAGDGGEAAALAEHVLRTLPRTLAAAEGLCELEHAVVARVGDVDIPRAIDGNSARLAQAVGADAIYVADGGAVVAGEAE